MKVVIDIPEAQYENLAKIANAGKEPLGYWERVVMRGTPLPKGHGRLIDVGKLDSDRIEREYIETVSFAYLDCLPTIIEADKEESE